MHAHLDGEMGEERDGTSLDHRQTSGFMAQTSPRCPPPLLGGSGGGGGLCFCGFSWVSTRLHRHLPMLFLPVHEAAPPSSHALSSGFDSPGNGLPVLLLSRAPVDGGLPSPPRRQANDCNPIPLLRPTSCSCSFAKVARQFSCELQCGLRSSSPGTGLLELS